MVSELEHCTLACSSDLERSYGDGDGDGDSDGMVTMMMTLMMMI